ncbi:MAG TPA: hypothetical protein VHM27_09490 [Rhizomicrobium sp.]|jgi:hypothetical protein|nr:hypothetical protein [Rhizomicrobium sp.]
MRYLLIAMAAGAALAPTLALADAREDVVAGLTRCAALADDRQWLDCYYGAAQPMRSQLGLSPAPQAQLKLLEAQPRTAPVTLPTTVSRAAARTGPPPMPKRTGVFNMWGGDDLVNNVPIRSYEVTGKGFVVTLNDGQVWAQTEDDASKRPVRWRQPASAMRVTISQGAMGSFNLVLGDENRQYKVRRVR